MTTGTQLPGDPERLGECWLPGWLGSGGPFSPQGDALPGRVLITQRHFGGFLWVFRLV